MFEKAPVQNYILVYYELILAKKKKTKYHQESILQSSIDLC